MKALGFALVGASALAFSIAAAAQQPAGQARTLMLSPPERSALQALETAARGGDRAAQDAALAAARAAARSAEARYAYARLQLEIARARQDGAMYDQAVDALVATNLPQGDELAGLIAHQAGRAYSAGERQRAERLLARAIELQPGNAAMIADLAQIRAGIGGSLLRDPSRQAEARAAFAEAVTLLSRAIQVQAASGQAVPESWYQRALALAYDNGLAAQGIPLARALVATYPSPVNWRDGLLAYKQLAPADPALDLDVRRLMRAAGALSGERDYLDFAALLVEPLPGEAKAVLDEGVSRGMLDPNEAQVRQAQATANRRATADRAGLARLRTQAAAGTAAQARAAGDAHFGYGQYAEAAELFRAALQKDGEDANLLNTRLGAALALAGRRGEAEEAFRLVTGPRAELAGFWLAWLARRPA